jgi:putative membrane protein
MSSSPLVLLRNLLYGLLMGGADVIPGVSGGTMALIVGVYEQLVGAISSAVSFGLALLRLDVEGMRTHGAAVPWGLVLPLAAGIGLAILLGARIIPGLMETYPEQMRGLFLGLVGASLVIPALRIRRPTGGHVGLGAGCALVAFYLTGLPVLDVGDPGLMRVFLSAAVAICAMILPGVSGAFLLEVLGIYTPTLAAVNGGDWGYVLTFMAGAAVGLGAFAKLLDWLLAHRHDATMAALVGLIAGALRALWPYVGPDRALHLPGADDPVGSVVGLAVLGFAAVLVLLWWGRQSRAEPVSSAG